MAVHHGALMGATEPRHGDLSIELRAAIDLAVLESGAASGSMPGRLVGAERLVAEFRKYALDDGSPEQIVFLGADRRLVAATLEESPAEEVVTLVAGPLRQALGPFRAGQSFPLPRDLGQSAWHCQKYELIGTTAVQGPGSIGAALAERLFRLAGRPDLADRVRIAMLRTLVAAWPLSLGTVRLRRYRRVEP